VPQVLAELERLGDGIKVFKAVGPVLAEQDRDESRTNVKKRLELIEKEL
jgi:chaperonin cofactor prefoldin